MGKAPLGYLDTLRTRSFAPCESYDTLEYPRDMLVHPDREELGDVVGVVGDAEVIVICDCLDSGGELKGRREGSVWDRYRR